MENLFAGIFGLVLGLAGVWTGLRLLKQRALLQHWKTTSGRVIERGTYKPDHPMLSAPAFRYAPLVRYSYQVDGKEFVSNSILPRRIQMPLHSTLKWAERQSQSFSDEVTVYFNPENPAESYLLNTSKITLYIVLVASSVALLLGLLFLLLKFTTV
jgi:Protein of unknown function (DUF3592)